ncbi:MAG TPA: response regulator transcription factor [Puia sp.]|nr:response regulator transcription factor [Puia sp.]
MNNILVIDDESPIRKLLEITLESNGYRVIQTHNSIQGLSAVASNQPDLVILDLGLPDESGHITLQKLRQWYQKPVLILSVTNDEKDIVQSLDNGANDYLVKPFRTNELLARIRTALRNNSVEEMQPLITFGELEIDLAARSAKLNNEILKLTSTQYALLALFVTHEGKVLTHEFLLKKIWGKEYTGQLQYLRVFVSQLRKKIETHISNVSIITESSIGYRFVAGNKKMF